MKDLAWFWTPVDSIVYKPNLDILGIICTISIIVALILLFLSLRPSFFAFYEIFQWNLAISRIILINIFICCFYHYISAEIVSNFPHPLVFKDRKFNFILVF